MTDRLYGGFWRRLFAYAIDNIILYFISLFLLLTALLALGLSGSVSLYRIAVTGDLPRGMGLYFVIYAAATFITDMIYFIWFHGSVGQTPGKMLLGLRVIQTSGEKMTFGVAFLRWVGTIASTLLLLLGYLWVAIDGKKQGWHDKIAATLVIRTASEPRPASPYPSAPLPETVLMGQPPADPPQGSTAAYPPSPPSLSSDTEAPRS
jgi:uncharacterized RDD family membrane protein YckC